MISSFMISECEVGWSGRS